MNRSIIKEKNRAARLAVCTILSLMLIFTAAFVLPVTGNAAARNAERGAVPQELSVPDTSAFNLIGPTSDATVSLAQAAKYKVTFNAQGGSSVSAKSVASGKKIGALKTPKNKNFKFKGWYTKSIGGKKITKNTKVSKKLTYYAHWKVKKGYAQATFKAYGYNIYKAYKKISKGVKLGSSASKKVTRDGYTFLGWYTKATGGTRITKTTKIKKNTTYYAQWKKVVTPINPSSNPPGADPQVIAPASVELSSSSYKYLTGSANKTIKINAVVSPANASVKTVTWTSSNTSVATVDAQGAVSFTDTIGNATITARTSNGKTATCAIEAVAASAVTKVEFVKKPSESTATLPMKVGENTRGAARTVPGGFESSIVWSSSNPAVVSVDAQTGELEARAAGTATITATVAGKTDTLTVTVKAKATAISVSPTTMTMTSNQKTAFTVTATPTTAFTEYRYTSSNESVAKISLTPAGKIAVEALHPGTATITIKEMGSGKTATIAVTVSAPPAVTGHPEFYYYACERQSNGKALVKLDIVPIAGASFDYYYVAHLKNYTTSMTNPQIFADSNIIADAAIPKNNPSVDIGDVTPGVTWVAVWAWKDTNGNGIYLEGADDPVGNAHVSAVPAFYRVQNVRSDLTAFPFQFLFPMADMSGGLDMWNFPITIPMPPLVGTVSWDTIPGAQGYLIYAELAGKEPMLFEHAQYGSGRQSEEIYIGSGENGLTIVPYTTNPLSPSQKIYGQAWNFTYPTIPDDELSQMEFTITWANN